MYQLAAGTPGYDQGKRIANFNDHFNGAAPDVGAAEAGDAAMKFGIAAASATPDTQGTASASSPTGSTGSGALTGSGGSSGSTSGATGTAAVSATMDSSSYTISAGQSVTFTAAVMGNSGAPTGAIAFQDGGSTISGCASVAVASGKALCTTSTLASGSHSITGKYSGDSTYGAGVAGPITETVSGSSGTTTSGSPVPTAPTQIAPSGTATTGLPSFTWTSSANATQYQVLVMNASGRWVNTTLAASSFGCGSGGNCAFTPSAALANDTYSWFVRAWNASGHSTWSSGFVVTVKASASATSGVPTAPAQIGPNASTATRTPIYSWSPSSGAASYRLLVRNGAGATLIDTTYAASAIGCSSGGACSIAPATTLASRTTYSWFVRANNASGHSTWSAGMAFGTP